jgi:hypothetical protein
VVALPFDQALIALLTRTLFEGNSNDADGNGDSSHAVLQNLWTALADQFHGD